MKKLTFLPSSYTDYVRGYDVKPSVQFTCMPTPVQHHDEAWDLVNRFTVDYPIKKLLSNNILKVHYSESKSVQITHLITRDGIILTVCLTGEDWSAYCELHYEGFIRLEF